jgi:hypothetical protein
MEKEEETIETEKEEEEEQKNEKKIPEEEQKDDKKIPGFSDISEAEIEDGMVSKTLYTTSILHILSCRVRPSSKLVMWPGSWPLPPGRYSPPFPVAKLKL